MYIYQNSVRNMPPLYNKTVCRIHLIQPTEYMCYIHTNGGAGYIGPIPKWWTIIQHLWQKSVHVQSVILETYRYRMYPYQYSVQNISTHAY
jgi:hypothetical protein